MADLERSIKVLLMGEDFNLDKTMKNASRDFDKFSRNVQDATQPLADFGRKAAYVEAALIAMVVGGLAYAANKAADFDSQFREITTLLDDTGQSIDTFRGDILMYAQDSVKSIEDINGAIYSAISAGVSYEDSLDSLADAEQLAVGTKADLGASTKTLVSILNAYGASSDEAAQYAEILFETVKNGQTTMPELANKIANVTSIAANSGVSFDELAAAIAAVTSTGLPTSETITGLKQTISNIIKPTSQAADMAEQLGIEFNAQALEANGLKGVLDNVKEATGGNTEQMTKLFGSVEALNIVMALTGEGAESFANTLEQTSEHTGSLSTAYEKMADDVRLQTQNLWNNVEATLIGVGDRVLASFEGVPGAAADLFSGIADAVDEGALDDIFDAIDGFAADFQATLEDIAENAPEALEGVDFSGLIEAFGDLGEEAKSTLDNLLGGDIDLTTVEGLEDAIQRLVNLFEGLTNFTAGFISGIQPMVKVVGKLGQAAGEAGDKGQFMAGKITGLAETANKAFKSIDLLNNLLIGFIGLQVGGTLVGWTKALHAFNVASGGAMAIWAGGAGLAALFGVAVGTIINAIPAVQDFTQAIYGLADSFFEFTDKQDAAENATKSFDGAVDSWISNISKYDTNLGFLRDRLEEIGVEADDLSNEKVLEISAEEGILEIEDLMRIKREADVKIEEPSSINIETDDAKKKVQNLADDFYGTIPGITEPIEVNSKLKPISTDDIIGPLEEVELIEVPVELKKMELEKQMTEIKASADTIQTSMEWKAKIDIAQAEAAAKTTVSAFETATNTVIETQDSVNDLVGTWLDADFGSESSKIWNLIEDREDRAQEAFEMQQKLYQAQLEMMELRKEQMEDGEALMNISIDDSVEPALKLVLFNILEVMQTELNEYANQFLTGIDTL